MLEIYETAARVQFLKTLLKLVAQKLIITKNNNKLLLS